MPPQAVPSAKSLRSVREAGLRFVSDARPGIARERAGKGFAYRAPGGRVVRDAPTLERIRRLAIPPAWRDVWICTVPHGHIQATGRDARGRKQYRYHPRWRAVRDETKYDHVLAFGKALPRLRARVLRDLGRPGLPREKVLAAVVRLLETTYIRVGNEAYARDNKHYGLTTLRDTHVRFAKGTMTFRFRGKSGVSHAIELGDPRLARVVRQCQALPGQELLQYVDAEGRVRDVDSADVNAYLKEVSGEDFTAKDFRTWAGTVLAALALQELGAFDSQARAKRNVLRAIERVSGRLGNTPSVCRKCYVHPEVINAYLDGDLVASLGRGLARVQAQQGARLSPQEAAVLALLRRRLALEARRRRANGGQRRRSPA